MKVLLYPIIALLFIAPALGAICEQILSPGQVCTMLTPSVTGCDTYNFSVYNETAFVTNGNLTLLGEDIYFAEMNLSEGDYLWRLCDRSTREIIVRGEDNMGSVAIGLFVLAVPLWLFLLPFIVKRFHPSEYADLIIRRGVWIIAFFFMTLASGIMMQIADFIGLDVVDSLFTYGIVFGWAGYISMVALLFKTVVDIIKIAAADRAFKRGGF